MGRLQASHTVEIEAPRERCWEVAADVAGAPEWNPAMESCEVLESDADGRARVVNTEADALVKKTKARLRFSYDPPGGLSWVQEEGEVKSLEGRWEFTELDAERTRATYALDVDTGRMLGMLIRGPVEGKLKEFLTKGAAEGLKQQVEGS